MDRAEVEAIAARFIAQARGARAWADAEDCVGLCDEASEAIAYWCERKGIACEIAHEARRVSGRSASHTVAVIGGWTVDLTARQYDADADFPSIY